MHNNARFYDTIADLRYGLWSAHKKLNKAFDCDMPKDVYLILKDVSQILKGLEARGTLCIRDDARESDRGE